MSFRGYFSSASDSSSEPSATSSSSLEVIKFEGRNLRLTKLIAEGTALFSLSLFKPNNAFKRELIMRFFGYLGGFSYVYLGDFGGQLVAVKVRRTQAQDQGLESGSMVH